MIGARACLLALGVALVVPAVSAQPAPAGTRVATSVSDVVAAPEPAMSGENVTVTGRVSSGGARRVVVQLRHGSRWTDEAAARTRVDGRFKVTLAAPAATRRLRVLAPAHTDEGRSYSAATSAAVPLTIVAQRAELTVPAETVAGTAVEVSASFAPARPGRRAELQRRAAGAWRTLGHGRQGRHGRVRFAMPAAPHGASVFRVRADPSNGAPAVISPRVTWATESALVVTPTAGTTVAGSVPVTVEVDPAADVGSVRIFAGGAPVAEATPGPAGTWLAEVDSGELSNGVTDLLAQVAAADGRVLTRSIPVRVQNSGSSTTTGLPDGFRIDTIGGGLNLPTSFAALDSHRTLVTEKDGLVRLLVDGSVRSTPVLDLTDEVSTWGDHGLIGIALDPGFAGNGWFYLTYVLRRDAVDDAADPTGNLHAQRVVRYTLDGVVAPPSSAHIVLGRVRGPDCFDRPSTDDCLPVGGFSHTVDDALFRPDGSLLVSVGDGMMNLTDPLGALRAQDLDILAGKVLRIDPASGNGLPGNPFYDPAHPEANRSRVWAYGFRNPFRLTAHPDGRLFVADVGDADYEEIDEVVAGDNYGWPCLEGEEVHEPELGECAAIVSGAEATHAPAFTYHHFYVGAATGGVFYTGDAYPASYQGHYVFGDYSFGVIFDLDLEAAGGPVLTRFADRPGPGGAVKFAIGPDGNIWYLSITTGELREIVYDPEGLTCPPDRFVGEYFSGPAATGAPDLVTCEATLPTGPGFAPPPLEPGDEEGFTVRWTGHPRMRPGTYDVTTASDGDVTVSVDGVVVGDELRIDGGAGDDEPTPEVSVTLTTDQPSDEGFALALEPRGTPPRVTLEGPRQGELLAIGTVRSWTVTAVDSSGEEIVGDDVRVNIALLHYGSPIPHVHPSGTIAGTSGSFGFDDDHAPGASVYRVTAHATDASGAVGASAPVYVCLVGNEVGPCGAQASPVWRTARTLRSWNR